MRGSEKLMPKAVKDMLKTSRYIYEGGIVSRSGSVIVDDMSVAELTGQAIALRQAERIFSMMKIMP